MKKIIFFASILIIKCMLAQPNCEDGYLPVPGYDHFYAHTKLNQLFTAIEANNINEVVDLLMSSSMVNNYCKPNTIYINVRLRLMEDIQCISPSSYAEKLGYTEIAMLIKAHEEAKATHWILNVIKRNAVETLTCECKYYEHSHWFLSKLPRLIKHAEKNGRAEAAQLLKDFQEQCQQPTTPEKDPSND